MKGLQIRIEREEGNWQCAGHRFRQLDAGVWEGRGKERAGDMLVSALTNAAGGRMGDVLQAFTFPKGRSYICGFG